MELIRKYINKFLNLKISNTMKRFSFLAIMLTVFCLSANAQEKSIREMFELPKPQATIAARNMNILYRGIDNKLDATVEGIADEFIDAEISDGKGVIKKTGKGSYAINVEHGSLEYIITMDCLDKETGTIYQKDTAIARDEEEIIVNLFAYFNMKKVYLDSKKFIVRSLKKPMVVVGSIDGGLITKESLMKDPYIRVKPGVGYDSEDYGVTDFQMAFSSYNNEAPLLSKTNDFIRKKRFTNEMIEKIKTLKKGDKIYIEGIRTMINGIEHSPENPQIILTIK